jgi:hypothetical protein
MFSIYIILSRSDLPGIYLRWEILTMNEKRMRPTSDKIYTDYITEMLEEVKQTNNSQIIFTF